MSEPETHQLPSEWVQELRNWARSDTRIASVVVFGSRAKGLATAGSDLDVAYTLNEDDPDQTPLGYSICKSAGWEQHLSVVLSIAIDVVLSIAIDLEHAMPDDVVVWPAVLDHGICVYVGCRLPRWQQGKRLGKVLMKSAAVDVKTASQVRANLKAVLDTVSEDGTPVIISRRKREPVVMVPLSEWNRWQERDAYAHVSKEDRSKLDEAIAQIERGDVVVTEWDGERFVPVQAQAAG